MYRVKGHRETNSSFIFIKLLTIWAKISFSRQDYSNTFILPNTKPNVFKYYGTNQGTTTDKSNLLISQTYNHRISFSRQGLFQYFYLTGYKPNMFKYYGTNQGTTSDKSKLLISQTCKHRGQNLNFASRVISFYRI